MFNYLVKFFSYFITNFTPVRQNEVVKYLYISIILFLFLFVQNILRNLKDTISVNLIGAEANNFYKLIFIPASVIFIMYFYNKAVQKYNSKQIFYNVLFLFLAWYAFFCYIVFPYREYFNMSEANMNYYAALYPNFKWYIKIIGQWSFGLFYVTSELWQSLVVTIVLWQFIMNIFTVEQSQRLFMSFSILSQCGLLASGFLMQNSTYLLKDFAGYNPNNIDLLVKFFLNIVLIAIFIGVILFYVLTNYYVQYDIIANTEIKSNKQHPGFLESLRLVMSSTYMILIALIILCYGSTVNMVESQWKKSLQEVSSGIFDYFEKQADMLLMQGVLTVTFAFLGANLIQYGWTKIAIVPVILTAILGGGYFASLVLFDLNQLVFQLGFFYLIIIKPSKYAFLDNTKEMAFKALTIEMRTKGKGSIDLIANKYGKALSSLMYVIMFTICPHWSLSSYEIIPFVSFTFFMLVIIWFISVVLLGQLYNKKIQESSKKDT